MTAPVVVILAAGQGTRMRSAMPKLLHPLCGRPIIEWSIRAAREAGAARVVLVDSPQRQLEALTGSDVVLAVQEQPRGTADAVRAAAGEFGDADTVVVLNGDVPLVAPVTLRALCAEHEASGAAGTIATIVLEDPAGYGRVVRAPDGTVERVVETKTEGDATEFELHIREVNTGMFAFQADALTAALAQVRAENAQGEEYLPDVLEIIRRSERTVEAFAIDDREQLLQINDRRQLAQVTAVAQRRIHEAHMLAGVTIVNPQATLIDADVTIGSDARIAPFSCLHGATRIGRGSVVGPHCTLLDAEVGEGATVTHSFVDGAVIGDRVSVGPYAYLRRGTVLHEGAKAGTFVEIKNSDVGRASKVPHLSYIGDASIGEGVNLGASTITANYDGYRKHRTVIGDHVHTGVDTTLVAPVTVEQDAWTAAGSVITTTIPAGALGVARSRQSNISGYADRVRERVDAAGGKAP